jgi:hypothetical protein
MRYALVGVHHPLRLDHVPPSPPPGLARFSGRGPHAGTEGGMRTTRLVDAGKACPFGTINPATGNCWCPLRIRSVP